MPRYEKLLNVLGFKDTPYNREMYERLKIWYKNDDRPDIIITYWDIEQMCKRLFDDNAKLYL